MANNLMYIPNDDKQYQPLLVYSWKSSDTTSFHPTFHNWTQSTQNLVVKLWGLSDVPPPFLNLSTKTFL